MHVYVRVYKEQTEEKKCSQWMDLMSTLMLLKVAPQTHEKRKGKVGKFLMSEWKFPESYSMDSSAHFRVFVPCPASLKFRHDNSSLWALHVRFLNACSPESYASFGPKELECGMSIFPTG